MKLLKVNHQNRQIFKIISIYRTYPATDDMQTKIHQNIHRKKKKKLTKNLSGQNSTKHHKTIHSHNTNSSELF